MRLFRLRLASLASDHLLELSELLALVVHLPLRLLQKLLHIEPPTIQAGDLFLELSLLALRLSELGLRGARRLG